MYHNYCEYFNKSMVSQSKAEPSPAIKRQRANLPKSSSNSALALKKTIECEPHTYRAQSRMEVNKDSEAILQAEYSVEG